MTTETIPGQEPIAWIIEPISSPLPYLTLKAEVAAKRLKAGDIVTPYLSKRDAHDAAESENDEDL